MHCKVIQQATCSGPCSQVDSSKQVVNVLLLFQGSSLVPCSEKSVFKWPPTEPKENFGPTNCGKVSINSLHKDSITMSIR